MWDEDRRTALGDLWCRQFKERKFKCEIKTTEGIDPCLKFYLMASDTQDPAKNRAVAQLFDVVRDEIVPPGVPEKPPNLSRKADKYFLGLLDRGIYVTGQDGGYDVTTKHYVLHVHFPAWQMDAAKRVQASFGRSVA